jgi:GTP-binding protein
VPKASPKKSVQKPRTLKQREGPSFNRRHGKELRAKEAANRKQRPVKPARGMSAAAQRHPLAHADSDFARQTADAAPRPMRPQQENSPAQPYIPEHSVESDLPLIAICGRPNVGKSTLFNRITQTRRSIVGDEPGITRDRIYGEVEWEGRRARIVDTGGIVPDDDALIPSEIFRQARVALEDASAMVMVIDGRSELASPDMELARLLIRTGKPVFLAVNKMDSAQQDSLLHGFHSLGLRKMFAVSAEHAQGIGDLLDAVFAALPGDAARNDEKSSRQAESKRSAARAKHAPPVTEEAATAETSDDVAPEHSTFGVTRVHGEFQQHETKVAIIGRPNVGKSTLLNALTGTSRAIVSPIAGTTRDAVDEVVAREGHDYRFVDTAGIRRKGKTTKMAEKLSVVMARKHLEAADCAVLVIDAVEGVTALDATIGGYAHESGRSVVIAVNKWDLVGPARQDGKQPADIEAYQDKLRRTLKFLDYAPVVFLSAQDSSGQPRHISRLFKDITLIANERRKRVTTGQMNRFLSKLDFQRAPVPMSRRMRIFYMTQAAVAPPTFILFTDRDVKLHFAFERFLENQIRAAFGFVGSPIWFKIKPRGKKDATP